MKTACVRSGWLALALLVSSAPHSAFGQVSSGAILGVVVDVSGARIPGVEITATNQGTNQVRQVVSSETGDYRIEPLQVGVYLITAELPGFRKEVRSNIKVDVDARLRIDFTMEVGSVSEVIEVSGAAPVVQTDSSQIGQVVEERKIIELPLNGRNFSSLAYITPGTFAPRPGSHLSERGGFVAAGMEEQSNGFLLDGVNGNAAATMEPAIRVNVDAIAEFKIQTQNYAAQYGRFAGAQVDAITKSGTNSFHGDLFFFTRTQALDARNFFDGDKPYFRRTQYGGVIGGPLIKNKAFFFAGFQAQRQKAVLTLNQTVPLPEFWTGNLSRLNKVIPDPLTGQPFPNSQIPPNRISKIALGFKPYWERAKLINPGAVTSNAVSEMDQPDDYYLPNFKVNYAVSSNHSVIFSYGFYKETLLEYNFNRPEIPGFQTCCGIKNQIISLQDVKTISPTMINELRAGLSRSNRTRHPQDRKQNYAKALGINGTASDFDPILWATPEIQITGYAKLGDSTNQDRVDGNWTLADILSVQKGHHALKFGADYMRQYINSTLFYFDMAGRFRFTGSSTGDAFADFLLGNADNTLRNPPVPGVPLTSYLFRKDLAFFVQDDWKVTSNLTLNAGFRWDYFGPMDEQYGKLSNFDPTMNGGQGGVRILTKGLRRFQPGIDFYKSLYPTLPFGTSDQYTKWEKRNPGPRLGFAWTPGGRTSTVLRGGYGWFYQVEDLCFCNNSTQMPFTISQTFTTSARATFDNPWPGTGAGAIRINALKYDVEAARYEHWNFGVQQELPGSFVVDIGYVAKRGSRVNRYRSINQPINGVKPYPLFSPDLDYMDNGIRMIYHGLQTRIERRAAKGLTILNSYTWSHMIDNGAPRKNGGAIQYRNSYDLNADRGNGVEDGRHRLSTSFVWDMPMGQNLRGVLGGIFKGWQVSGIIRANSGNQLTPTVSTDYSGSGRNADRPDRIGNPTHVGKTDPRVSYWPKSAFQLPARGTYGTSGRGILRAPGYFGTDMSFVKKLTISESQNMQLRWEMFNIFNHPNFFNPVTVFNAANFGTISQAQPSRQMQIGLKYAF